MNKPKYKNGDLVYYFDLTQIEYGIIHKEIPHGDNPPSYEVQAKDKMKHIFEDKLFLSPEEVINNELKDLEHYYNQKKELLMNL